MRRMRGETHLSFTVECVLNFSVFKLPRMDTISSAKSVQTPIAVTIKQDEKHRKFFT